MLTELQGFLSHQVLNGDIALIDPEGRRPRLLPRGALFRRCSGRRSQFEAARSGPPALTRTPDTFIRDGTRLTLEGDDDPCAASRCFLACPCPVWRGITAEEEMFGILGAHCVARWS